MQKPSAFSSILHRIWPWGKVRSYSLDKAVKETDIDDVIDILKSYNNEKMIREALCKSVIADDISLVQAILQHIKIANVSDDFFNKRKCNWNDSPLFIACKYGNPEIVSLLCGSGFLINVVDEYNRTPLLVVVAIRQNHLTHRYTLDDIPRQQWYWKNTGKEIVSLLIEKGADINITESEYRRTPLHYVCFYGTLEIVRNLLDNGANINAKDSHGNTPLFYCLRNHIPIIGLHSHRASSDGHHMQLYLNNIEEGNKILKYLVERGADINCRNTSDLYVLELAYITCRPFATLLLFKYGGVNRRNWCGRFFALNWKKLILADWANADFWIHLVRHTSVCRRIYLDIIDDVCKSFGRANIAIIIGPFMSMISETEMPLSLKDQCRICIGNTISTYTEPGLQYEKCINTLCMPNTLKSFLMYKELEQFVSIRDCLPE